MASRSSRSRPTTRGSRPTSTRWALPSRPTTSPRSTLSVTARHNGRAPGSGARVRHNGRAPGSGARGVRSRAALLDGDTAPEREIAGDLRRGLLRLGVIPRGGGIPIPVDDDVVVARETLPPAGGVGRARLEVPSVDGVGREVVIPLDDDRRVGLGDHLTAPDSAHDGLPASLLAFLPSWNTGAWFADSRSVAGASGAPGAGSRDSGARSKITPKRRAESSCPSTPPTSSTSAAAESRSPSRLAARTCRGFCTGARTSDR